MKTKIYLLLGFVFLLSSAFSIIQFISWQLDENYTVKFETKKAKGTIKGLKGTIVFDDNNLPESNFKVSVDVNTIDLGIFMKTSHAKSKDFFDVKNHPSIDFQSNKVEKTTNGFTTTGNLIIKGISKEVTIVFSFEQTEGKGVFVGSFDVELSDFELNNKGVEGSVKIDLKIPVVK